MGKTQAHLGGPVGRARLLVLDAPGGPHPRLYAPILGSLAELNTFYLPSFHGVGDQRAREQALEAWGRTYRVEDRAHLPELLDEYLASNTIDGVLTFSEMMVQPAAEVAERLGLPFNSVDATKRMQRKDLQRQALAQHGIPVPAWSLIQSRADLDQAAAVGFPAVFKPVIGMGGLSVRLVHCPQDLSDSYDELQALYRADPRVRGHLPNFMVEEVLVGHRWHGNARFGDYVSVESILVDGEISHLAITDKLASAYPFRETGDVMPSTLPQDRQDEILGVSSRAIKALGATSGAIHTEIMLTTDGARVIEVNGRVGGGVTELLAETSDFDIVYELGRIALGLPPRRRPVFHGFAAFLTPQPPARDVRVRFMDGVESLGLIPGIKDVHQVHDVGSVPKWRAGTSSNMVRLYALSPTFDGLLALMDRVDETLVMEFDDLSPSEVGAGQLPDVGSSDQLSAR